MCRLVDHKGPHKPTFLGTDGLRETRVKTVRYRVVWSKWVNPTRVCRVVDHQGPHKHILYGQRWVKRQEISGQISKDQMG